jgi:hypothetical protein
MNLLFLSSISRTHRYSNGAVDSRRYGVEALRPHRVAELGFFTFRELLPKSAVSIVTAFDADAEARAFLDHRTLEHDVYHHRRSRPISMESADADVMVDRLAEVLIS